MFCSWLREVEAEVEEAAAILDGGDSSNLWWAERIRKRLLDNSPPDPAVAVGDQATTLLEISFWSGWLKGELDTLERCRLTFSSISESSGTQLALPLSPVPPKEGVNVASAHESYARHRLGAERLIERMDSMNFLPGAELVSIQLNSVLESRQMPESSLEAECIAALEEFSREPSTASLVRLSFNSGMLAGLLVNDRSTSGGASVSFREDEGL